MLQFAEQKHNCGSSVLDCASMWRVRNAINLGLHANDHSYHDTIVAGGSILVRDIIRVCTHIHMYSVKTNLTRNVLCKVIVIIWFYIFQELVILYTHCVEASHALELCSNCHWLVYGFSGVKQYANVMDNNNRTEDKLNQLLWYDWKMYFNCG